MFSAYLASERRLPTVVSSSSWSSAIDLTCTAAPSICEGDAGLRRRPAVDDGRGDPAGPPILGDDSRSHTFMFLRSHTSFAVVGDDAREPVETAAGRGDVALGEAAGGGDEALGEAAGRGDVFLGEAGRKFCCGSGIFCCGSGSVSVPRPRAKIRLAPFQIGGERNELGAMKNCSAEKQLFLRTPG